MTEKKASTTGKPKRELPEAFRQNAERVAAGEKPLKGKSKSTKKGR